MSNEVIEIPLTRGYVALVGAEDAERVRGFKWHACVLRHTVYAVRNVRRDDGTQTKQSMHAFLVGEKGVDHVNGNGLDNRRSNLRSASLSENGQNRRKPARNTSGFKGVTWKKRERKWQAQIGIDGKLRHLGLFATAEEAGRAYDQAARDLHGPFATLNFPRAGERAA